MFNPKRKTKTMFEYFSKEKKAERAEFRVAKERYEKEEEYIGTRCEALPLILWTRILLQRRQYHEDSGDRGSREERNDHKFNVLYLEGELELAEAAVTVHELIKDRLTANIFSTMQSVLQMNISFNNEKMDAVAKGDETSIQVKKFSFHHFEHHIPALWERVILLCQPGEGEEESCQ